VIDGEIGALMKYLIGFVFFLLTVVAFADDTRQHDATVIDYTLNISFSKERQKIIARLHNKSVADLQIHRNSNPSSFFSERIKLFAFQDSEDLSRLPSYFSINPDSDLISIKANDYFEKEIGLGNSRNSYCSILNKGPILVFWFYSYHNDKYTLFPSVGVFRIKKVDVNCKIK